MTAAEDRFDTRIIRWIWISVATLGGSLFLIYFLAGRGTAALIVAVAFPLVALAIHIWIRRRSARKRGVSRVSQR